MCQRNLRMRTGGEKTHAQVAITVRRRQDEDMSSLHHRVDGSGPVVVLLHAGVADLRMWDAQVDALIPGHAVVRCDLPGYGGSPLEAGSDGCDAEGVLALLEELDVEGFGLVGASSGGYVALQIASAVPDRVERLVLLDAAADLVEPDESLREIWRQEEALVESGDLAGATDLMVSVWLGPDADEQHRVLLRDMQRRAYDLQVAAGDDVINRDLPVDLARITAPVTVIVGGLDLAFFRATALALTEGLPHAHLVELSWARHLPSLERPAEAARLVATALA
jgi:pimeloyl-ACP methyl ester carboxylesterase